MTKPIVVGSMMPIRVLIADDQSMVREGLRGLFATQGDIKVVGEAGDGFEAIRLARELRPDVLLLDLAMPRLGGLIAAKELQGNVPETKVVVLSMLPYEAYGPRARSAGAVAYILKGAPASEILVAIRAACRGSSFPEVLSLQGEAPTAYGGGSIKPE